MQLLSQNLPVEVKMGKSKEVCESEGYGDLGSFSDPAFILQPKSLKNLKSAVDANFRQPKKSLNFFIVI